MNGFIFNCTDCGKTIKVNNGEVYLRYLPNEDVYEEICKECAVKTKNKEMGKIDKNEIKKR